MSPVLIDPALDMTLFELALERIVCWRKQRPADDDDGDVVACIDYVLNAAGDADRCRRIEEQTGKDPRSQMDVDTAQYIYEESELRKMGHKRN